MWSIDDGSQYTKDRAFVAWFKLTYCVAFFVLGSFVLWRFYKARRLLDIRKRSAYLVVTLGVCLLLEQAMHVHVQSILLFGARPTVFMTHLVYFFITFTVECCYFSRVIRLGVQYSPRLKRSIPFIFSERFLVFVSLAVGLLSMSIPGYYYNATRGEDHITNFVRVELDVAWKCQVALVSIQVALLPIVWMVDDIYKISWELVVIVMVGIVDAASTKLATTTAMTPGLKQIVNSSNFGILSTSILFGLSVVDPMRRLMYSQPVAGSSVSCSRKCLRSTRYGHWLFRGSASLSDSECSNSAQSPGGRGVGNCSQHSMASASSTMKWDYDTMASRPAVASAFKEFAGRALCQESIMFLEEVTKYEDGDYSIAQPTSKTEFAAFSTIVKRFILDGSADEINISSKDKDVLLDLYEAGAPEFWSLSEQDRRCLFRPAYAEIRSMLEVNLIHRFIDTDDFRSFRKIEINTPTSLHGLGNSRTPRTASASTFPDA